MASVYPGALDNLALGDAPTNLIGPDVEDLKDAVNKIEATLGVNPQGASATVAARFLVGQMTGSLSAAYTVTNVTTDRTFNADAATLNELADVVGTLIADLKARGVIG